MRLTAWPITQEDVPDYTYDGGTPDDFLWTVLDGIGGSLQRGTDGSNLAPELLDPFVFAQFVTGLQGKYTVNGMPFAGNWRLLPAARRMAERLGANALADALREGEAELATWDPEVLDKHDNNGLDYEDPEERQFSERLFERFDKRFEPLVGEGVCTYGTPAAQHEGAERLLAALADWISAEMPREVLPNRKAVQARHDANHLWAWDHVENYGREYTRYHVGTEVYDLLTRLGLRYSKRDPEHAEAVIAANWRNRGFFRRLIRLGLLKPKPVSITSNGYRQPHLLQVIPYPLASQDGRTFIRFTFGDGVLLARRDTLEEVGRVYFDAPRHRPDHLPEFAMLRQQLPVRFDPKTYETRVGEKARGFGRPLRYSE